MTATRASPGSTPKYGVPEKAAIRGFHSWTVSLRDIDDMHFFMNEGWNHDKVGTRRRVPSLPGRKGGAVEDGGPAAASRIARRATGRTAKAWSITARSACRTWTCRTR